MFRSSKIIFPLIIIPVAILVLFIRATLPDPQNSIRQPSEKGIKNSPFAKENEQCLRCHGEKYFTLTDSLTGMHKNEPMARDYRISRDEFYNAAHWNFSCLDCHSPEFQTFPHSVSARFEQQLTCLDCHDGDKKFAQYKFEQISEEYMKSFHYTSTHGNFSCFNCHDPHSYHPVARNTQNIDKTIVADNNICLNCHGNEDRFQLLSSRGLGNVIPEHDWLPNQELHLRSIRCIDCHAEKNANLLIPHKILPADSAVGNCVECHSKNSILMATLYKYNVKKSRETFGFINSEIINNNAYVIGANRSRILNFTSILICSLVLMVIAVHIIVRLIFTAKH